MKWLNYIVSLVFLVIAVVNFMEPFIENYSDEYLICEETQSYDDLFYPQDCHEDGFYWLGNLTKTEFRLEGYVPLFSDETNSEFIEIIENASFTALSPLKAYFVTLVSGNHNELTRFVGNVSISFEDMRFYDKEAYEKILKLEKNNIVTSGTFLKVFGKIYLYAYIGDISESMQKLGLFSVDDLTAEKLLSSEDILKSAGGIDFICPFSFDWLIKEVVLLVLYFLIRPLKEDRVKIRKLIFSFVGYQKPEKIS